MIWSFTYMCGLRIYLTNKGPIKLIQRVKVAHLFLQSVSNLFHVIILTLSWSILPPGGEYAPLLFFLHHPKTAQVIKLKLSDFKDTLLRHILQVIPGCNILRCYHGNKITDGTWQDLAPKTVKNQPFVEILSWNLV